MRNRFHPAGAAIAAFAILASAPAFAENSLGFTLGFGANYAPSYFGANHSSFGPSGKLSLDHLSVGSLQFGSPDPKAEKLGFGLRGAFRFVGARKAADYAELAGLNDTKTSVELGMGLGYEAATWRAFADLRYGVIGHHASVAEFGADWKAIKTDSFQLSIGPRLEYGSRRFNQTYFGVTAAEAVSSGLAAFAPGAGLISAGLEIGAAYDLGNDWGVEGTVNLDRLKGDAANSPIAGLGSRNQASVSVKLTRRFNLSF